MSERNNLRKILADAAISESPRRAIGVIISGARVLAFGDARWLQVASDLAQVCPPMSAVRGETKGAAERVLGGVVVGLLDLECKDRELLRVIHGLEQLSGKVGCKLPSDVVGRAVNEIVSGLRGFEQEKRLSA